MHVKILNTIEEIYKSMNEIKAIEFSEFSPFIKKLEKIKYNVLNNRVVKKTDMKEIFNECKRKLLRMHTSKCSAINEEIYTSKIYLHISKLTAYLQTLN